MCVCTKGIGVCVYKGVGVYVCTKAIGVRLVMLSADKRLEVQKMHERYPNELLAHVPQEESSVLTLLSESQVPAARDPTACPVLLGSRVLRPVAPGEGSRNLLPGNLGNVLFVLRPPRSLPSPCHAGSPRSRPCPRLAGCSCSQTQRARKGGRLGDGSSVLP